MQNVVDKTRTQVRMFKKTLRRARSFRAAREKINKEVRSNIFNIQANLCFIGSGARIFPVRPGGNIPDIQDHDW